MGKSTATHCEICGRPLDDYAKADDAGYCSRCVHPEGKMFEILNFFIVLLEESDLVPHDPVEWHDRACDTFPDWPILAHSWCELRGKARFEASDFPAILEFLVSRGKTHEEIMLIDRDDVVAMITEAIIEREFAVIPENAPATSFLGDTLAAGPEESIEIRETATASHR